MIGLVFGSFLNVCISRIPHDHSIVAPRSYCPACRASIAWHDNIPLLSWILLRGRCRACGAQISLRYPSVELLTAILFVACYACFDLGSMALKACALCFLLVGLIFMDAETGLLPAEFTYTGIGLGLLFSWFAPVDASGIRFLMRAFARRPPTPVPELSLLDASSAVLFGAGFFLVAWALYYLARKRHGLWFGDIAMIAMIAAFLGLKLTVLVVFLAPILGTLYGASLLFKRRREEIAGPQLGAKTTPPDNSILLREVPFGVFLGTSALIALFFGESIWRWYLGFFT